MPSFTASQVVVTEEDDVLVVGFDGGMVNGEPVYLTLQYARGGYTEQDARLGMSQPYIEYCDQGWGWYGNMTHVELRRDRLVVTMSPSAATRLDGDGIFDVGFALDDPAFDQLRAGLETTFAGLAYFAVRLKPG